MGLLVSRDSMILPAEYSGMPQTFVLREVSQILTVASQRPKVGM